MNSNEKASYSILQVLFKMLGYTPTAEYEALSKGNQQLARKLSATEKALETETQKSSELRAINAKLEREKASDAQKLADAKTAYQLYQARLAWCVPDLVIIPPTPDIPGYPVVPERLQENIKSIGAALVHSPSDSPFDLCHLERFIRPSQWALYWALAHAAHATIREAKTLTDENGLSDRFVDVLTQEVANLPHTTGVNPPLELGVTPIFRKKKPAVKEDAVGADILLVVAGSGLLPTDGARLFWLQAKLNDTNNPYLLDFWRPANSKGIFQYDALRALYQPKRGSLSLYTQYSPILPFVACVSVGEMPEKAPPTKALSKVDLRLAGQRLQELLTLATCDLPAIGTFSTADEVLEFLDIHTNGALLPLNVVSVCAKDDRRGRSLLVEIQHHFEVEMGIVPKREKAPDIGLG